MNEDDQPNQSTAPNTPATPQSEHPVRNIIREIIGFIIIALIIVVPIRLWVAQPFVVSGDSMDPTFATGQYLIVNQLSYHFENPSRGQVIIFKYPKDTSEYFIKRVIGLPGEEINLSGTSVNICKNPPSCSDSFTLDEPYVQPENQSDNMMQVTLGPDQYFVMGDNRRESSDSRAWGPVPRDLIVGSPLLRLLPLSSAAVNPGKYTEPASAQ